METTFDWVEQYPEIRNYMNEKVVKPLFLVQVAKEERLAREAALEAELQAVLEAGRKAEEEEKRKAEEEEKKKIEEAKREKRKKLVRRRGADQEETKAEEVEEEVDNEPSDAHSSF